MTVPNSGTRRNQYTAIAAQTTFSYNFEIIEDEDLLVYLAPVGQDPDLNTDILVLTTDYTVTNAGDDAGGNVILVVPATAGDIITIKSNIAATQLVNYKDGGEFTGESIQAVIDKLTLLNQQIRSIIIDTGLVYNVNDTVTSQDTTLPKLEVGEFWKKSASGGLIAASVEEDADVNTLRSELESKTQVAPGSGVVGHYDATVGQTTVSDQLISLSSDVGTLNAEVTITGTANAIIGTTSLGDGIDDNQIFWFTGTNSNTAGAVTLNIDSTGVFPVVFNTAPSSLLADDIVVGGNYFAFRRGSNYELINPQRLYRQCTTTLFGLTQYATNAEFITDIATKAITPSNYSDSQSQSSGGGYQRFPGGLILQWGFIASGGTPTGTINFPVAFANPVFHVSVQLTNPADTHDQLVVTTMGNSSFGYDALFIGAGVDSTYFAIGF